MLLFVWILKNGLSFFFVYKSTTPELLKTTPNEPLFLVIGVRRSRTHSQYPSEGSFGELAGKSSRNKQTKWEFSFPTHIGLSYFVLARVVPTYRYAFQEIRFRFLS